MKLIVLLENFFLNILCLKMFLECKIDEEKGPFQEFIKLLKELEYNYISFIANAENYGFPKEEKDSCS